MSGSGSASAFNASSRGNGGTHPRAKRPPRQQKGATLKHGATVSVRETFHGRLIGKAADAETGTVNLSRRGRIELNMKDGSKFIIYY